MRKNLFVEHFVNTVYAIILGFGFGKTAEKISATDSPFTFAPDNPIFFQVLMAFFVIIVICLYWWDWSENIKDKVESTFSEFTIDLCILFTLQMMLLNSDNPLSLVKLFLILSFWDLLWVVNYSKRKEEYNFGWLRQKSLALFLYGLAWHSILKMPENIEIIKDPIFLTSIPIFVIFVTFFLVRLCCFRNRPF